MYNKDDVQCAQPEKKVSQQFTREVVARQQLTSLRTVESALLARKKREENRQTANCSRLIESGIGN